MKPLIIVETIEIGPLEILEVDSMILANMRERLNPRPVFSYANGDHLKSSIEDEKRMRERQCDKKLADA
jgi:hypothetical protein